MIVRCWNTGCEHNDRFNKPHPTFSGYCLKKEINIGRQNTESVKCYDNTNTKSRLKGEM